MNWIEFQKQSLLENEAFAPIKQFPEYRGAAAVKPYVLGGGVIRYGNYFSLVISDVTEHLIR